MLTMFGNNCQDMLNNKSECNARIPRNTVDWHLRSDGCSTCGPCPSDHQPPLPSTVTCKAIAAWAPSAKFCRSSSDMSVGTPYSWPITLCSTWVRNVHSGVGFSYFEVCQTLSNYLGFIFLHPFAFCFVFSSSLVPCCKGWDDTMVYFTNKLCIALEEGISRVQHHKHHPPPTTSSTNKGSGGKHEVAEAPKAQACLPFWAALPCPTGTTGIFKNDFSWTKLWFCCIS